MVNPESELGTQQEAVAIDGKALRGIHGDEVPGVRLVSTYSHRGLVVGQKGGDPAHAEEIAPLLERVRMADRVLTARCSVLSEVPPHTRAIDYLFIVKTNQKGLYEDIELCFDRPVAGQSYAYADTVSRHADRRELRRLWATDVLKTYLGLARTRGDRVGVGSTS